MAHVVIQGLQGLQINYGVVQVQDGLKTDQRIVRKKIRNTVMEKQNYLL